MHDQQLLQKIVCNYYFVATDACINSIYIFSKWKFYWAASVVHVKLYETMTTWWVLKCYCPKISVISEDIVYSVVNKTRKSLDKNFKESLQSRIITFFSTLKRSESVFVPEILAKIAIQMTAESWPSKELDLW